MVHLTDKADFPERPNAVGSFAPTVGSAVDPRGVPSYENTVIGETVIHEVAPGDNLSRIARQFYGDAGLWKLIFDANRGLLTHPDRVESGQLLKIPPRP